MKDPLNRSAAFEMDMQMASDAYKDIHGIRPRHLYAHWRTLSDAEMYAEYLKLATKAAEVLDEMDYYRALHGNN
jgi:hypothetical protein